MEVKPILIVDDDPNTRRLLELILEREGYHVMTTGSGHDALQWAQDHPFSLVITDYFMSGMNGPTLVQRLRELTGCATLPIIMLTARDQADLGEAEHVAGVDCLIVKPFFPPLLVQKIKALLQA